VHVFTDGSVTITAATGGLSISGDNVGGLWTSLTGPILKEAVSGDIGSGSIILTLPSGFIFDIGGIAPTVLVSGGGTSPNNINNIANGFSLLSTDVSITSTTITINISSISKKNGPTQNPNTLTFQNLRVRPTAITPLASGNITKSGTSSFSTIPITPNYGTLNEIAGTATKFIITGSGSQTAGTPQSLTITAQTSGGSTATAYAGIKSLTFSGANSSPSPVTIPSITNSTGSVVNFGTVTTITFTNGVANVSGSNNGSMTLYKAENATIVANDGPITTTGSDRLGVTVNEAALANFFLSFTSPQINGTVFTGTNTIAAQDAFGNTVTTFDASANNVIITTSPNDGAITGLGSGNNAVLNQVGNFSGGIINVTGLLKFLGILGSHTFTATSAIGTKAGISGTVNIIGGAATQIALNAGDSQTATAGSAVATPPGVIVKDANNSPVSGVTVSFAVASGGGIATGLSATTNASGIATIGSWTLGTTVGTNTLTATGAGLTGSPITFTATSVAGAATQIAVSAGNNQTATAGSIVAILPSVIVKDANSNPVSGVSLTFVVASGGGSVAGATTITNASGIATVGSWTLANTAGSNTLTVTKAGLTGSPITFTATGTAGAASQITINAGDGQTATAGAAVIIDPSVKVTDAFGNAVSGVSVTFAVTGGEDR